MSWSCVRVTRLPGELFKILLQELWEEVHSRGTQSFGDDVDVSRLEGQRWAMDFP